MSIIIIQFNSEIAAKDKLQTYDSLAELLPPRTLTKIYQHITLPIWFFSGTTCIQHGGTGRAAIQNDIETLSQDFVIGDVTYHNTFVIEKYLDLVDMGYWPQPVPPK